MTAVGNGWPPSSRQLLQIPGPHGRTGRHRHRPVRVGHDQGCDRGAGDGVIGRGGAEAALERRGDRAKSGTGVAKREVRRRPLGRGVRQGTVRGYLAPQLVATIGEVEDDRTADERDDGTPADETPTPCTQPRRQPGNRVDPVSSAAGQDQGADVPHQPTAAESIGVIGAGNAAPHVRSGEQRSIGQHHRDAGKGVEILCIADKQSGDVSQTVAWPGLDQDG